MGQLLVRTIGFRPAERALALGTLFPSDQALNVGLVDELVPAQFPQSSFAVDEFSTDHLSEALSKLFPAALKEQASNLLMQKAYQHALLYATIPPQARVASKMVTRSEFLKQMMEKREGDTDHFCCFIRQDEVQKNLRGYVEALKKRSKKIDSVGVGCV